MFFKQDLSSNKFKSFRTISLNQTMNNEKFQLIFIGLTSYTIPTACGYIKGTIGLFTKK